jgi:putative transposase
MIAFVIGAYARRIVEWRVSRTPHASFVRDAIEQALHERRPLHRGGLVHHSDRPFGECFAIACRVRGSQYVSIKYSERLAEAGIEPSVGSVGDSYDNALAEAINELYKAESLPPRMRESSIGAGLGGASKPSSSRRWNGSAGSITAA